MSNSSKKVSQLLAELEAAAVALEQAAVWAVASGDAHAARFFRGCETKARDAIRKAQQ